MDTLPQDLHALLAALLLFLPKLVVSLVVFVFTLVAARLLAGHSPQFLGTPPASPA